MKVLVVVVVKDAVRLPGLPPAKMLLDFVVGYVVSSVVTYQCLLKVIPEWSIMPW